MMNINDLPSDILTLVLKYAVGRDALSIKNWKSSIPLLAVCRKWRILASPWVHYWGYVECYDSVENEYVVASESATPLATYNVSGQMLEDIDLTMNDETQEYDSGTEDGDSSWATNIDFHMLCGNTSRVRKIEFYLDTNMPLTTFLRKACATLKLDIIDWSKLRNLSFQLNSIPEESVDIDRPTDSQVADVVDIAIDIARGINKVTTLEFRSSPMHMRDEISMAFGNALLNLYSDQQLIRVSSTLCIRHIKPFRSIQLKHLKLLLDNSWILENAYIPADHLKNMIICDAPLNFPWEIFSRNGDCTMIKMPNLEHLIIMFSYYRQLVSDNVYQPEDDAKFEAMLNNKSNKWTLALPIVKLLQLEYPPPDCPIFHSFPEPQQFSVIHITAPLVSIQKIRFMNIKCVEEFHIVIDSVGINQKDMFYETTNHLFGDIRIGKKSELKVRTKIPFKLEMDKIRWINIKSFAIGGDIEFSSLLNLIEASPGLKWLCFKDIIISDFIEYVEYIDSPKWKALLQSPLKSNLVKFYASGTYSQLSAHCISNIIHFLIHRIKSLEYVYMDQNKFVNQIDALLALSSEPHPNVRRIELVDPDNGYLQG